MSILIEDEIIDVNLSHMDVRFEGISNEGVVRGLIDVIKNDLSEAYDCDWTIHLLEIIIIDVANKLNMTMSPSFRIDGNYIGGTKCDVVLHGYMTMHFSIIFNYSLPKDIKNPDMCTGIYGGFDYDPKEDPNRCYLSDITLKSQPLVSRGPRVW